MRFVPALSLCAALLAPAAAVASPQCDLYTRNIAHYQVTAERMDAAGKDLWEEKTREHIKTLEQKRAELCPEWSADAQAARAFRDLMRLAGKAALTYFTFGAF